MANKTYAQWRQEKLTDPVRAVRYLKAAFRESDEAFFHAVKNVVQANQVSKIAKEVGVARESIYRSFSEEGNPAYLTVKSVLEAVGVTFDLKEKGEEVLPPSTPPKPSGVRYRSPESVNSKVLTMPNLDAPTKQISVVGVGKPSGSLGSLVALREPAGASVFSGFQAGAAGGIVVRVGGNTTSSSQPQKPFFLAPIECLLSDDNDAKELIENYG